MVEMLISVLKDHWQHLELGKVPLECETKEHGLAWISYPLLFLFSFPDLNLSDGGGSSNNSCRGASYAMRCFHTMSVIIQELHLPYSLTAEHTAVYIASASRT